MSIPRDCENLPGKVPYANLHVGLDSRIAIKRSDAQIDKANDRIAARDACMAQVREQFGGAK